MGLSISSQRDNYKVQSYKKSLFHGAMLDDPYYCGLRARVPNFVKGGAAAAGGKHALPAMTERLSLKPHHKKPYSEAAKEKIRGVDLRGVENSIDFIRNRSTIPQPKAKKIIVRVLKCHTLLACVTASQTASTSTRTRCTAGCPRAASPRRRTGTRATCSSESGTRRRHRKAHFSLDNHAHVGGFDLTLPACFPN
ncbi:hypothetical protein EVAR_45368_1 [Eumeta japonica]|uniref:Uncharacterized protein n=1 Tax=Eumeta variegata TaxID=151549 RepID=A0A4C1XY01_EUMVA|nr:hypothetical protein EVAR_45368_1 [Eumeta japonica]